MLIKHFGKIHVRQQMEELEVLLFLKSAMPKKCDGMTK